MILDLRKFFQATNPSRTLAVENEEDQKYYIDFSSVRGGKIIEELRDNITYFSPDEPTCELFTGHIGCGKSTELRRLEAELKHEGFHVVYFESSQDLEMGDVDIGDILLAIARRVSESLEHLEKVNVGEPQNLKNLLRGAAKLLQTEIELSAEASVPGVGKVAASTEGKFSAEVGIPGVGQVTANEKEGVSLVALGIGKITAKAKHAAQTALSILANVQSPASDAVSSEQSTNLDWVRSYHQGWYLFSLARAHSALGHAQEAIANLETAVAETKPYYDPELFIRILEELRSLYFKQGDYLQAFHIKQDQRSIEQQYGFRAFVGAGRLQPKQEVANPALSGIATQGTVAQEIAASGRQQDVNRLVERIGRSDHKLTVIQGQSGVGKSSLVQAGLIPALKQKAIGTRDVVPVLQQVYTDWVRELGKRLREALVEAQIFLPESETVDSLSAILDQLRKNAEQNLLTVLIFDQFEEFFFVCKDPVQRRLFYEFMRDALDVPYTKVILSLREDYLYYLLECNNRLISLEVINNNILDKHILYYLGNFSVEDAKSVIQNLTELAQFPLEPILIDALVQDLAGELGEVRPIELQVVGAQLRTEKIGKLEQYRKHGPKEKLVERFLEEVVKDCGPGNEQIAKLVLYLLTDENNTRPLKTRSDLELELDVEASKLDLVLEIFVKSRLVFQVPALPVDRYQLVHDYLVAFVRQQQSARLIAELEKEREQRKLSEARLNQVLKQQLREARRATITLAGLLAAIGGFAVLATLAGINFYLTNLSFASAQNEELDQLVSALKVGKQLKHSIGAITDTTLVAVNQLNKSVNTVQELNRLEGHADKVTSISFSYDGNMIGTSSKDKTAKVWNIDGKEIITLKGHKNVVKSVSLSSNGERIATSSEDNSVRIWDIKGKTLKPPLNLHKDDLVSSISLSPDGRILAVGSNKNKLRLWNIDSGKIQTLLHKDNVINVAFSPDSKKIAAAGKDDTVKLWNIDGKEIGSIKNYGTLSMDFSSDGQTVIFTNQDRTVKFYALDGTLVKNINSCCSRGGKVTSMTISPDRSFLAFVDSSYGVSEKRVTIESSFWGQMPLLEHSDSVTYLKISPNSKVLASASDKTVKLWGLGYGMYFNLLGRYYINSNASTRAKFSQDGKMIATGSADNRVKLWRRDSGGEFETHPYKILPGDSSVLSFSPDSQTIVTASANDVVKLSNLDGREFSLGRDPGTVTSISFSPDGKTIALTKLDNTVQLWKNNGTFIQTLTGHTDKVKSVIFSDDSQIIAIVGNNNVVKLWKSNGIFWKNNGTLIHSLFRHTDESSVSVNFSPDGKTIASNGDDNLVKLWRSDGTLIKILKGHNDKVKNVIFSPNSEIIASLSQSDANQNSEIKLWRTNGHLLKAIDNYGVENIYFSPDSKIIASTNIDKTIKLWSFNGTLLATLQGHQDTINDLSFSPNGEIIATTSADSMVRLWRKRDGKELKTLRSHNDSVNSVMFSPNGQMIATASDDKTVKLWSSDGREVSTPKVHDDKVNSVSFSPDGKTIATASDDNKITLWGRNATDGKKLKSSAWISSGSDSLSFSPNGKMLALASGSSIKLYLLNYFWFQGPADLTSRYPLWNVSFSPDSKAMAIPSNDGRLVWHFLDLDELLMRGCDWARGYLKNNVNAEENDRKLCDDIPTQK